MPRTRRRSARVRIVKIVSRRNPSRRRKVRVAGAIHRPRVRKIGNRFFRSTHSTLFAGPTMLNPRRRRRLRGKRHNPRFARRSHRRYARRNPNIKSILNQLKSKAWMTQIAVVGGGIVAGLAMKSVVNKLIGMSGQSAQLEKFGGALQIVIGAVLYATMRKPALQQIGAIVAGVGLYDLIQRNANISALPPLTAIGIPGLSASYDYSYGPRQIAMPSMVPAARPLAASYGASYTPAAGLSGMDNPYGDIEW